MIIINLNNYNIFWFAYHNLIKWFDYWWVVEKVLYVTCLFIEIIIIYYYLRVSY